MAGSFQHPDCLTLPQDVELFPMKKTFGLPKALLECGPVHPTYLTSNARRHSIGQSAGQ